MNLLLQLGTYPPEEWARFAVVMFLASMFGGLKGSVVAGFIITYLAYLSDAGRILAQPEGDLDAGFLIGFSLRIIPVSLQLTFGITLPCVLIRRPLLRFDSWSDAFWKWRLLPPAHLKQPSNIP